MTSKKQAISVLKKIIDPELGIDIYTLGLIYEIKINQKNNIFIKMTLTTPFCPYGPAILDEISEGLKKRGFKSPEVELVFEKPWEPSKKVKMILGLQ